MTRCRLHPRAWLTLIGTVVLSGCAAEHEHRIERDSGRKPAAATVVLTPRALAVAGVESERAAYTTVPEVFLTTGEIEFDPSRLVVVNAPVVGRIRLFARSVGERVAAGDTLVTLESPEFLSGSVAVAAPRGGVVTTVQGAPQQLVSAGQELLRIVSVGRVWLRVDLYGDQVQMVQPGRAVEATVGALPGLGFRGRIASVAPSVEGATQAAAARVPLDNPEGRLLPGMFASVRVPTGRTVRGILVPRSAIIYDGTRRLVMIARDSTFFPSAVQVGSGVGDRVVVLRGVSAGERVVIKGGYELYNAGFALTRDDDEEGEEAR
jgi:multidrug efflux pump subunit AcrA (membrane-fusion protein)